MSGEKKNVPRPAKAVNAAPKRNQSAATTTSQPAPAVPTVAEPPTQPVQRTSIVVGNSVASAASASRAAETSGEKAAKGSAKIYRNPRNSKPGNNGGHRPIGPRGSVVLMSDNLGLDRSKAVKGVEDSKKTMIKFKDVKGNIHEHRFPDRAAKKWEDEKWISALNKWRYQTIGRKFKHDPAVQKSKRGKWSIAEKAFLQAKIKERVEETGDRLLGEDWRRIAKAHNEQFAGKVVKKGEMLLSGKVAARDFILTERTAIGIRAAYDKMQDVQDMVEEILDEFADEDSSDGEVMEGVEESKEKHGGDLDHHLEDPSDDEDDGKQPASNPVGGILISTC